MQLQHPLGVITPTLDGDLLTVLAGARGGFTPARLHSLLANYSEAGVRKSLKRLSAQGIVLANRVGKGVLYELNRDHLAAAAVIELANTTSRLVDRIAAELSQWDPGVPCALLFGSAARGEMKVDSDLDVFLVHSDAVSSDDPKWQAQVESLRAQIVSWTGNDVRFVILGEEELHSRVVAKDALVRDVNRDGLLLFGDRNCLTKTSYRVSK